MTGLSTLVVELDAPDGSGTWPHNITAYVDLTAGWSLTRGRGDELDAIDTSQLRMVLNNNDGRFTLGDATYGGLVIDQRIRVTETVGATTSRRFTGYVQDWPVEYADPGARNVPCRITATDRLARYGRRKLTAALAQEQLADAPSFLYTLGEASGSGAGGDTSGNQGPSLTATGTGAVVAFGADTGTDQTGVKFAGGRSLLCTAPAQSNVTYEAAVIVPEGYAGYEEVFQVKTGTGESFVGLIVDGGTGVVAQAYGLNPSGNAFTATATPINDGVPHLITIRVDGGTSTLFVDGVIAATASLPGSLSPFTVVRVGLGLTGVTVFGVAAYPTALSDARIAAHYRQLAVTVTESTDVRLARLASYGNVPSGDLAFEAGVETSLTRQSLSGVTLAGAMGDVVTTEGGTLFVNGDGETVAHNRQHRVWSATQAPAVTLDSDDIEHGDFRVTVDKQYLRNEVTGSRVDGAQLSAKNQSSIDMYEQYPDDLPALLVATDEQVRDRINWQVGAYGQPAPRLNQVTINLFSLPAAKVQALLALELGDRVTIDNLPSTSPIDVADLLVEGSEEQQSATSWTLALNTVSASLFRAWILGDATYGVLGTTTRPHY